MAVSDPITKTQWSLMNVNVSCNIVDVLGRKIGSRGWRAVGFRHLYLNPLHRTLQTELQVRDVGIMQRGTTVQISEELYVLLRCVPKD